MGEVEQRGIFITAEAQGPAGVVLFQGWEGG